MKSGGKLKWLASILLVICIVLITNLIDRKNFNSLSDSVTTMFEDRIVASDLIFEMSQLVDQKHHAVLSRDTLFLGATGDQCNQELDELIGEYERTKLTPQEADVFELFKAELAQLRKVEGNLENWSNGLIMNQLNALDQHLWALSKVQVKEGKRQLELSNKAMDSINLFTQWEMIFLILMAIGAQIVIMYKPLK